MNGQKIKKNTSIFSTMGESVIFSVYKQYINNIFVIICTYYDIYNNIFEKKGENEIMREKDR